MAGIDQLNTFGHLNTIDALSGGDVTKYDQVLLIPWVTIYTKQQLLIAQGAYKKRLYDILNSKTKKS